MTNVYLLLGSNEGEPMDNLTTSRLLIEIRCGSIIRQSSVYETEAWGIKHQKSFLNQAILVNTDLTPAALLETVKQIENELGRIETVRWGPRIIDIDILFYGNETIDEPDLNIPHPFIQDRRFTLVPMQEIAPDFMHPILEKTMAELLAICKDTSEVKLSN